mmetsp:Transcript_29500/g.57849  ORF Transcript_29500/g.57849 Transcript_29500/m.57849 type:complete len:445 (+) Transcript_29500:47-1381(+)|eukprot:CAMPEP_0172695950 /NCGR_PEP_ID=MMETSP1074-20121228/27705_1 /TAXON_ID=2916 /ORGANISM="Ceratium fusus, Strain PA161109" /LENGTH=444 /DNA_ID=CAMNT_0013516633 /DNA_START=30 /DNA_END=1364 /DNA_ORIENTATION=-
MAASLPGRPTGHGQFSSIAAQAAFAVVLATSLQGCVIRHLHLKGGTSLSVETVADGFHRLPIACQAFEFKTQIGIIQVAGSRAGESPDIACPTDFTYGGPRVECSWVDRVCVSRGPDHAKASDVCWDQFNLTLAGQGLVAWPSQVEPRHQDWHPPRGSSLRSAPLTINLAEGRRNASALPNIIMPEVLRCVEEPHVQLDFEHSQVVASLPMAENRSLGWSLRFAHLARVTPGGAVDLIVTRTEAGQGPPGDPHLDGKGSAMGRITINSSLGEASFKMQFVKEGTNTPVALKKVFFSMFDVVDGIDAMNNKDITVSGVTEYFVSAETRLSVEKIGSDSFRFYGDGTDKKLGRTNVGMMWRNSLHRTVALMFRDTSEFELKVVLPPGGTEVREMEFAGWSEIVRYGRKVFSQPRSHTTVAAPAEKGDKASSTSVKDDATTDSIGAA